MGQKYISLKFYLFLVILKAWLLKIYNYMWLALYFYLIPRLSKKNPSLNETA